MFVEMRRVARCDVFNKPRHYRYKCEAVRTAETKLKQKFVSFLQTTDEILCLIFCAPGAHPKQNAETIILMYRRGRQLSLVHCVSEKTRKLWNGVARNCKDRFWQHLEEIFKTLWNRVCMFQFLYRFAFFIDFSSFKPDIKNNANFDAVSSKRANFDQVRFL